MPFVTEEIWQRLPNKAGPSIMVAPFPAARPELIDPAAEREMDVIARAIDGARSVRGEVNLPPNQQVPLKIVPRDKGIAHILTDHLEAFKRLALASRVDIGGGPGPPAGRPVPTRRAVHWPTDGWRI